MASLYLIDFPEFSESEEILKIGRSEVCVWGVGVAKGQTIKSSYCVILCILVATKFVDISWIIILKYFFRSARTSSIDYVSNVNADYVSDVNADYVSDVNADYVSDVNASERSAPLPF